jgi:flavoprotein hydroxylase
MTDDADVLIVGSGPVGLVLAILLAQYGHRVQVLERWAAPYARPRAVHFDGEVARVLADAGIGGELSALSEPSGVYDWQNADGKTLVRFDWTEDGPQGWPAANMFHQPALEKALEARAAALPSVSVQRGAEVVAVHDAGDHVEVTARDEKLRARYVVGCDGAKSLVRSQIGADVIDLGFFYDWLIVDVLPHEAREWTPHNLQICDPARPTTVVSGGPGRRRWEFMRLPGESVEALDSEETAWRLLKRWQLTPANATLERHTVYTFQAQWTKQWRRGRIFLAGDAAHLMPPFAGQGMCSGIRDAANLAWKLDLALRGRASDALLDTYGSERSAHVQHAIGLSVGLGNVICVPDAEQAAARDAQMLAVQGGPTAVLPPLPPEVLGPGVVHVDRDGALIGAAGQLAPQGIVSDGGRSGLFDEIVGSGFALLTSDAAIAGALSTRSLDGLCELGTALVVLDGNAAVPQPFRSIHDAGGSYSAYLAKQGWTSMIIRPDHYVFGGASFPEGLDELAHDLLAHLEV